ncbi:MAG: hypothetical protein BMS9Abin10_0301 [Gammaproteobacteria bacterium]|nr:MAG: hypothetical protein BMS9Abin10_0301 [Gammaproteobacteria bacterium]
MRQSILFYGRVVSTRHVAMNRSESAPSAAGYAPRRFRLRSQLLRAIAIVIAVKQLALVAIKLAWFSTPPRLRSLRSPARYLARRTRTNLDARHVNDPY